MEPSLIGWEWQGGAAPAAALRIGRNGAQPYRLGMARTSAAQKSPGNHSRNGAQPYRLGMAPRWAGWHCPQISAAMEPSLIGWEWWAPRHATRVRARSRNGAQPYRLGMAGEMAIPPSLPLRPQWSPALSAGNGVREPIGVYRHIQPQWSPALSAGNGIKRCPHSAVSTAPQWSPALSAGNGTRSDSVISDFNGAAMEPSLIGWEWPRETRIPGLLHRAAMEPSLIGWEWDLLVIISVRGICRRNGAQPYRLGMGGSA